MIYVQATDCVIVAGPNPPVQGLSASSAASTSTGLQGAAPAVPASAASDSTETPPTSEALSTASVPEPATDFDLYVSSRTEDFSDLADKGFVYLAKINVEGPYFDTWAARLVAPLDEAKSGNVHLISQGKSGAFGGVVRLHCKARAVSWERAGWENVGPLTSDEAVGAVHADVIEAIIRRFCQ